MEPENLSLKVIDDERNYEEAIAFSQMSQRLAMRNASQQVTGSDATPKLSGNPDSRAPVAGNTL